MAQETVGALLARGMRRRYGAHEVLEGLDLDLTEGSVLALLGRSGSGKSTLLRCLAALENPDAGDIDLLGQPYCREGQFLREPWEIRRRIGIVFQELNLFPHLTVLRNVSLGLERSRGLSRKKAEDIAEHTCVELGLEGLLSRYPSALSGGQAQRVAIARALVLEPDVLLLDEVTSALDPETEADVVAALRRTRELESAQGTSFILVTHLVEFAERFADRIGFLAEGRIVDVWDAGEFREQAAHAETRRYLRAIATAHR